MEPHPVPQNIIDVEFKLFGSFTLRQFSKILFGCLAGVVIFLFNINPIIKFPLILIAVLTGIGLAIIPNLGTWLKGFIKALFVSPRYVWIRQVSTPELFMPKVEEVKTQDQRVQAALTKRKLSIDELPLEEIFGRTDRKEDIDMGGDVQDKNFLRVYEDVFGREIVDHSRNPYNFANPDQAKKVNPNPLAVKVTAPDISASQSPVASPKPLTQNDYLNEINRLKHELSLLNKDERYKDKEQEILNQINALYSRMKSQEKPIRTMKPAQAGLEQAENQGRVVYGIVVNKKDNPIDNAEVLLTNTGSNKTFRVVSSGDGKFTTVQPLPKGEYIIQLRKTGYKFHTYKITIGDQNLPAYKFREK